jgi:hypothetical protein
MITLATRDTKQSMRLSFRADMEKVAQPIGCLPVVDVIVDYNPSPTGCAESHRSTSPVLASHACSVIAIASLSPARTDFAAGNRTPACPARSRQREWIPMSYSDSCECRNIHV